MLRLSSTSYLLEGAGFGGSIIRVAGVVVGAQSYLVNYSLTDNQLKKFGEIAN